ncbi:MAG: SurA N-terminal domain-containing protein [Spirochaetota bacterium]
MASQTPNSPAGKSAVTPAKKSEKAMWGIKNPFIYAGTVVFLVVVIVAFVFFPTSAGVSGSGAISFGTYAGKPINYAQGSYMVREVQAISEANPTSDTSDTANQLRNYQIYRNAFEGTVVHEGVLDSVASAGITVPDEILDKKMASLPQFQENGAFSSRLYRQMASTQRLDLRNQLRADYLTQSFTGPVYNQRPSSKETAFLASMAKETRSVEYAIFPLSSYPDADLATWASANAKTFERLKLSRITMAKEADIAALKKKIEGGLAFAEAAKSKSTDGWASQGGDMGLRFHHDLASDLATKADAEKVSSLAKGAVSPALKTTSGAYAIYKLEDAPLAAVFTDPAILADARSYLMSTERGKVEEWAVAKAKVFAALPAKDFAANAKAVGATVKSAGPFSLDFGDLNISLYGQTAPLLTPISTNSAPELVGASRSEKFLTLAFSLAPGALSEPLVLGENVLVLRVKEAGTKADEGMLALYYPYFYQQKIDEDVRSGFLKSPKLKDKFMDVYLKYFTPKPAK